MFRAGLIVVAAMLLIAAAPIPKPSIRAEHQGPEHSVSAQGKSAGADQRTNHLPTPPPPKIDAKANEGASAEKADEHHQGGMDWTAWIEALGALATAAFTGVLAAATIRLWNSTKGLHDETKRLATLAEAQSEDMKASIKVAQRAAETAEKTLITSDRPWVEIKAEISGPLEFSEDKITASVTFVLKNKGRSPATNVRLYSGIYPDLFVAQRKCAERANSMSDAMNVIMGWGNIFFPNDPITIERDLEMPWADFIERIREINELPPEVEGGAPKESIPHTHSYPAIYAVAFYVLPADPKKKSRYTTLLLEFMLRTPIGPIGFNGDTGVFEVNDLVLVQSILSGQAT